MHRLLITSVILFVAIAVFVNNAYASPIRGFHVRAEPTQSSPPSPSATGRFTAVMNNLLPTTGSKPSQFSSWYHIIGYGLTEYENGVEAPLSRISVIVDGIKDQPRFKSDIFLVSTRDYTFREDKSLCMVYTSYNGMKKFKSLPLIYEKKEIDSTPPAYERQQSSSQTGTPSVQKQLITFFAAKLSSETATTRKNVIVMRIDESHVKKAKELDLRTHCLKKGEKIPTNLWRLWAVAEWDKYKVTDWPLGMKAETSPRELTIQSLTPPPLPASRAPYSGSNATGSLSQHPQAPAHPQASPVNPHAGSEYGGKS
ncbi:hypothetical protein J3R30DRAFT_2073506 [Lentinula aciculospora]|uniref:Secreted protein n=1 Tax=Lentinula aciculospora TaxID=153920 RepID=A0A9W8ZUI1_9AGAR|nr:hypothetical protein J3R30DRAFT_2073506 [Lentinula aciculospora]